jgi:trigger factor
VVDSPPPPAPPPPAPPPQAAPFTPRARGPAAAPRRALAVTVAAAAAAADREVTLSEEELPGSRVRATITIPPAAVKQAYRNTLASWNAKIAVKGYRKGKAPDSALIDALGGQERVDSTVLSEMVERAMQQTLGAGAFADRALADSEALEQDAAELGRRYAAGGAFCFSVTYDIMQPLTWRTPHRELSVAVEAASSPAAEAAVVAANLRALRKENAQMRVAAGRGLARGDVAIVDFEAADASTGDAIPAAARQSMRLDTDVADAEFLPGVVAAMEGMVPGEERATTITFPTADDFQPAALRGKAAAVRVKLSELFEWDLPAADDAWAASLMGPGSTLEDLMGRLAANARDAGEDATRQRLADAFTDAVSAAVEVEVPESMLQEVGRNEYTRELTAAVSRGQMSFEQVEQLLTPQLLAKYVERKRPELLELQRAALGFADILTREGLVPAEADVAAEMAEAAAQLEAAQRGDVDEAALLESVTKSLQSKIVMDFLLENCKVTVTPAAE